jgi:hypothetical protein
LQNSVVRPAVVFEEKLNVIFRHDGGGSATSREPYLAEDIQQNRNVVESWHPGDGTDI